jgi:hypothetical protein
MDRQLPSARHFSFARPKEKCPKEIAVRLIPAQIQQPTRFDPDRAPEFRLI